MDEATKALALAIAEAMLAEAEARCRGRRCETRGAELRGSTRRKGRCGGCPLDALDGVSDRYDAAAAAGGA